MSENRVERIGARGKSRHFPHLSAFRPASELNSVEKTRFRSLEFKSDSKRIHRETSNYGFTLFMHSASFTTICGDIAPHQLAAAGREIALGGRELVGHSIVSSSKQINRLSSNGPISTGRIICQTYTGPPPLPPPPPLKKQ